MIHSEIGDELSSQSATQGYNFLVFRQIDRMNFISSTINEYEKTSIINFSGALAILQGLLIKNLFYNTEVFIKINKIEEEKQKIYNNTRLATIEWRKIYFEYCISQFILMMVLHQKYNLVETAHGEQPKKE